MGRKLVIWALVVAAGCGSTFDWAPVVTAPALSALPTLVWASDAGDVFLVGQDPMVTQGWIAHSRDNGLNWGQSGVMTVPAFTGVFGVGPTDVWVVGPSLALHTIDGTKFTAAKLGALSSAWNAVWSPAAGTVYLAGAGIVRSTDGGATFAQVAATTDAVTAVWGASASDVYAVTAGGDVWHATDGATFARSHVADTALAAVGGSGASDVYLAGAAGRIFHSVDGGATWLRIDAASRDLHAIWGAPNGAVYLLGDEGVFFSANGGGGLTRSSAVAGFGLSGNRNGDLYATTPGRLYHETR